MANFGTYQGHRILSDAMNNTVGKVVQGYESKIQQDQWKKEYDEQVLNNDIARRRAEAQFAAQERENKAAIARENIIRNTFANKDDRKLFSTTADLSDEAKTAVGSYMKPYLDKMDSSLVFKYIPEGSNKEAMLWSAMNTTQKDELAKATGIDVQQLNNYFTGDNQLAINPEYEDILDNWTKKHSYADYLAQSGEGWSGQDLTYDDLTALNEASMDFAKTQLTNRQKQLSTLSESEVNNLFKNNAGLLSIIFELRSFK